jgi:hypothetical protein
MQLSRQVLPLALAIGLVAAAPAAAHQDRGRAPIARSAGSDPGPPVYPGLVNTRLQRTQKALDRAVDYADDGDPDKAISALYTTRLQLKLAWRAGRYAIEHAPPAAPAPDARRRVRNLVGLRARASAVADQYTTAGGVLDLQHTVAETAVGMIDMAHGKLRDSLSRTIFTALDQRDTAVAYIHSIDVPAPPPDDRVAHASGAPVGGSWGTVMPAVAEAIDDEVNQIDGVVGLSTTLGAGVRRVLGSAEVQMIKTQRTVNELWPPVPGDD